jgi:hypothetical protein
MLKYRGGQKVGKGTYWDLSGGRRIDVATEEVLPGDDKSVFSRFPAGVMLLLGPILGLLYVIFLPFMAIAMMITLIGRKVLMGTFHIVRNLVSFGWRPTEAYLAGKKKERKKDPSDSG